MQRRWWFDVRAITVQHAKRMAAWHVSNRGLTCEEDGSLTHEWLQYSMLQAVIWHAYRVIHVGDWHARMGLGTWHVVWLLVACVMCCVAHGLLVLMDWGCACSSLAGSTSPGDFKLWLSPVTYLQSKWKLPCTMHTWVFPFFLHPLLSLLVHSHVPDPVHCAWKRYCLHVQPIPWQEVASGFGCSWDCHFAWAQRWRGWDWCKYIHAELEGGWGTSVLPSWSRRLCWWPITCVARACWYIFCIQWCQWACTPDPNAYHHLLQVCYCLCCCPWWHECLWCWDFSCGHGWCAGVRSQRCTCWEHHSCWLPGKVNWATSHWGTHEIRSDRCMLTACWYSRSSRGAHTSKWLRYRRATAGWRFANTYCGFILSQLTHAPPDQRLLPRRRAPACVDLATRPHMQWMWGHGTGMHCTIVRTVHMVCLHAPGMFKCPQGTHGQAQGEGSLFLCHFHARSAKWDWISANSPQLYLQALTPASPLFQLLPTHLHFASSPLLLRHPLPTNPSLLLTPLNLSVLGVLDPLPWSTRVPL